MRRVILNVVKNLKSASGCTQILRFAQDDTSFMLRVAWLTLCISLSLQSGAQEPFRVMFWNVENLFDTQDDPQKNDNEFLPDAARHWTYPRYRDKLTKVAQTIVAAGPECVPDLVGLCEVENDSCLDDLTRRSPLHEAGYRYVMTHSPDRRGIDVALLYQRSTFRLLHHQSIRIPQGAVKRSTPTRDILHVAGKLQSGDTLDVMVCHLPSRSGGKARTEPFRMVEADIIARTADSLVQVRQHPYLIVMGDFNDYPTARLTDRHEGRPAQPDEGYARRHLPLSGRVGDIRPVLCVSRSAGETCGNPPFPLPAGRGRKVWGRQTLPHLPWDEVPGRV